MITHVIDEAKSPVEADTWTMWCGAQVFVFDSGETAPKINFYHENVAHRADCGPCKDALKIAREKRAEVAA